MTYRLAEYPISRTPERAEFGWRRHEIEIRSSGGHLMRKVNRKDALTTRSLAAPKSLLIHISSRKPWLSSAAH